MKTRELNFGGGYVGKVNENEEEGYTFLYVWKEEMGEADYPVWAGRKCELEKAIQLIAAVFQQII